MNRTRRTFGRDFKLKAVRFANSSKDRSIASIANELEIDRQALWAWIKEIGAKGEELAFPGSGRRQAGLLPPSHMTDAESSKEALEVLRMENSALRMKLERTIAERDALERVLERAIERRADNVIVGGDEA